MVVADQKSLRSRSKEKKSPSLIKNISLGLVRQGSSVRKTIQLRSTQPGTKVVDISLMSSIAEPSSPAASLDASEQNQRTEEVHHTAVIPVYAPFDCVSTIRHRELAIRGNVVVSTVITARGPRSIHVESLAVNALVCSAAFQGCMSEPAQQGSEAELKSCSLTKPAEGFPQSGYSWLQTSLVLIK